MHRKSLLFIWLICFIGNYTFSMEFEEPSSETVNGNCGDAPQQEIEILQESSIQETRGKEWDWFITYLRLSHKTEKFAYKISSFDPAIRIYDGNNVGKLIMAVQRIIFEGKNTSFPNKDVSIESTSGGTRLVFKDNGQSFLGLMTPGGQTILQSYGLQEEDIALQIEIEEQGKAYVTEQLIQLFPVAYSGSLDHEDFFKQRREEWR